MSILRDTVALKPTESNIAEARVNDAVTLSLARAHMLGPDGSPIVLAIGAAIASNTLVKSGLAIALGGWAHGRTYGLISMAALLVGAAGLMIGLKLMQ